MRSPSSRRFRHAQRSRERCCSLFHCARSGAGRTPHYPLIPSTNRSESDDKRGKARATRSGDCGRYPHSRMVTHIYPRRLVVFP
jgi:hypothetical protein